MPADKVLKKPHVFIGSSTEGVSIAQAVQAELAGVADSTIWTQDFFRPGESVLEGLCKELANYQFAVLVFTADDVIKTRDQEYPTARANVVFELGLFTAALGRQRAIALTAADVVKYLPSDLAGITTVTFTTEHPSGLRAALGPACTALKATFNRVASTQVAPAATLEELMPRLYRVLMHSVGELRDAIPRAASIDRAAAEMFIAVSAEFSGVAEPMSDELILDVESQLQDCRAILATDVLGPSNWMKPIAYRYLASQIRTYLRRNIVNDRWNLLLSQTLAEAVSRALLRVRRVKLQHTKTMVESLTLFDNEEDFLWGVGTHRLQFSRILLWTREEMLGPVAESVIAVHESFHVPLFAIVVEEGDPRRAFDFLLFAGHGGRESGWCNARVQEGFKLRRLQAPGRIPVTDAPRAVTIFEELLQAPTLLFAKDARHLLENGAELAGGNWPVPAEEVADFLAGKGSASAHQSGV